MIYLLCTHDLLKSDSEILNYYHKQFKFIFVDEFQDTNVTQYNLLKLLKGEDCNIFVVGDDDQSIYSLEVLRLLI